MVAPAKGGRSPPSGSFVSRSSSFLASSATRDSSLPPATTPSLPFLPSSSGIPCLSGTTVGVLFLRRDFCPHGRKSQSTLARASSKGTMNTGLLLFSEDAACIAPFRAISRSRKACPAGRVRLVSHSPTSCARRILSVVIVLESNLHGVPVFLRQRSFRFFASKKPEH